MMHTQPLANSHDENLWKVRDVAEFTRFSRSWVYKQLASGQIPYVEVGGHPRFVPAAIRAWVVARAQR